MNPLFQMNPLLQACLGGVLLCGVVVTLFSRLRSRGKQVTPEPTYLLQFPPSRRHVLGGLSALEKSILQQEVAPKTLHARALPSTRAPDMAKDNQYTPTGFSTQEIRALGRFPDYALLSGVRYPQPCPADFDITRATFRPFRPFRWNYHQTMCMYLFGLFYQHGKSDSTHGED